MPLPTEYRSYFALSDVPVTGHYRHNNSFQILPAPPEAPRPPCVVGAYPLIIELAYSASSLGRQSPLGHEVNSEIINAEVAQEKLKQLLLLLTTFTSFELFVPSNHQGWFITLGTRGGEAPDWTPRWGQEMYPFSGSGHQHKISNFTIPTASLIKQVDPVTYFNAFGRPMEQVLELPATGELLLGDVIQPKFASLDGYEDRELHRNLIRTCRICIVNWVSAQHQP
jgi:hypothetical protein